MNIRLLKSKMVLVDDTVDDLADYLGQSRQNVYYKFSGERAFSLQDVATIAKKYNLTNDEIVEIFIERGEESEQANCKGSCEQT